MMNCTAVEREDSAGSIYGDYIDSITSNQYSGKPVLELMKSLTSEIALLPCHLLFESNEPDPESGLNEV